jgi:hypothetical protein
LTSVPCLRIVWKLVSLKAIKANDRANTMSNSGGQMDLVFSHLAESHSAEATFLKVNAEEIDEVAEKFEVSMVCTHVICC